jgi:hypothetical protein
MQQSDVPSSCWRAALLTRAYQSAIVTALLLLDGSAVIGGRSGSSETVVRFGFRGYRVAVVRNNYSRANIALCDQAVGWRVGNTGTEAGVRSTLIVVNHPLSQDEPQIPFIQHDQPIQALSPNRADQPLAERIRLRASHPRLHHRQPHAVTASSTVATWMLSQSWIRNRWG